MAEERPRLARESNGGTHPSLLAALPDEHGPIDSVRWELFREGLEDYEYMRLAGELAAAIEEMQDALR